MSVDISKVREWHATWTNTHDRNGCPICAMADEIDRLREHIDVLTRANFQLEIIVDLAFELIAEYETDRVDDEPAR